jgi:hypothetical protein
MWITVVVCLRLSLVLPCGFFIAWKTHQTGKRRYATHESSRSNGVIWHFREAAIGG